MPNKKIIQAVNNGELQNKLYKFRPLNSFTEDLIVNGNFFFSLPKDFNDPYEFNIRDSGIYSETDVIAYLMSKGESLVDAQEIARSVSDIGDYSSNLLEQAKSKKSKQIGVLCLSETLNNILLWAHYADNHKGCAIGIDVTKLPDDSFYPYRVNYQNDYPHMEYLRCRDDFLKKWALTKSNDWRYETERRIILNNRYGVINIPKEAVVEVVYGCRADVDAVNELNSKILLGNPLVTIRYASISHSKYEMVF